MAYLLDSNIISDLVRNPKGRAARRARAVGGQHICTSIIVAAELRYGTAKKGSRRLSEQVDEILFGMRILPFKAPSDRTYGLLRAQLESMGMQIGNNDLLIAAQAMDGQHTMVTGNEREFRHIDGLLCENWLRDTELTVH